MDQSGQGQCAPAARQVLEAAGGTGLIDLQPALAHRRHLADHGDEVLLVHPFEQQKGLEAVAHRVLPQPIGLIGAQVAGGDASPQVLGLAGQLAVLVWNELQQRLRQVVVGSQIVWSHSRDWRNRATPAAKAPAITSRLPRLRRAKAFCGSCPIGTSKACLISAVFLPEHGQSQRHECIRLGVGIAYVGHHRAAQ